MDVKQFEILSKKLDTIILLLSIEKLEGKTKTESILLLNGIGLDYASIAGIVGTTSDAVSARVSDAKKAKAKQAETKKPKAGKP